MSVSAVRRGFSVNVFLPTGDPQGLKVVEKSNWTGRGLVIPKAIFGASRQREELSRTGVYLLVGPGETSALPIVVSEREVLGVVSACDINATELGFVRTARHQGP